MILYVQAQVPKDTNKLQHQSFNVSLKIKTFTITIPLVPELKHAYLGSLSLKFKYLIFIKPLQLSCPKNRNLPSLPHLSYWHFLWHHWVSWVVRWWLICHANTYNLLVKVIFLNSTIWCIMITKNFSSSTNGRNKVCL